MEREEASQIIEEIESNEQLGDEENTLSEEELEEMCDEEDECEAFYGDDDYPEEEVVQVTKTITVVSQPVITAVEVGAKIGPKGEVIPVCKVSIERHHEGTDGADVEVFNIIVKDIETLAGQVRVQMLKLKKETNKGQVN